MLKEKNAEGFLVTNHKNIFYLTGFCGVSPQEREALLIITARRAILVVPQMYAQDAGKLPAVQEGIVQVQTIEQKRGFYGTALALFGNTKKKVIIESRDLSVFEHAYLKKSKSVKLIPHPTLCEELRVLKDTREIRSLQKAARITDRVYTKTLQYLQPTDYTKITEEELADKMLLWGKAFGADGWAFAPIIACGVGSASPHYHTQKQKLRKTAPLLMDFGFCVDGYNSDMSRTIFLGRAPKKFKEYYEIVRSVQEECANYVCPGVNSSIIDQNARDRFAQFDLDAHFIHSLGHGLGLDVHELPYVGPQKGTALREGMVVTIEPGLYFPGKYGIRIEDDVVVTKQGRKILTKSTRRLVEVV